MGTLSDRQVNEFIERGFLRLDEAFPRELARQGREILWRDTGCDPGDPSTWTKPVVRLGGYFDLPFREAANTPLLRSAYDQLCGVGRWQPIHGLGTFPVRFPSKQDPGDTGWHADASFSGSDGSLRLNYRSKGRVLLMLFLFSDVGERDAPTRILPGSHVKVPHVLRPAGENGMSFIELAQALKLEEADQFAEIEFATGPAGTVYLCHPFLIHGAQMHHGAEPRFLAQPPLLPASPIELQRCDGDYSPVEIAIRRGLV